MDKEDEFKENGYCVLDDLFTGSFLNFTQKYFNIIRNRSIYLCEKIKWRNPDGEPVNHFPIFNDNADPFFELLLILLIEKISEVIGEDIFPSYSFVRVYEKNSFLSRHIDRESCGVSLSVNINQDAEWPLYINENPVILSPGQGVLYNGRELEHHREAYSGEYYYQVFFHYITSSSIKSDPRMKKYIFDGREDVSDVPDLKKPSNFARQDFEQLFKRIGQYDTNTSRRDMPMYIVDKEIDIYRKYINSKK